MKKPFPHLIAAGALAVIATAACTAASRRSASGSVRPATVDQATLSPAAQVRADSGRPPYTAADVHFMSGMIPHHAQAVLMAGWAPTHGASPAVRTLCERIVVAQRDEIAFMQRWLRERHEAVPDADASHHMMPGMDHSKLMPGMLTAEQLTQLDRARGPEFDRLFLTFMIQHHEGAITMVEQLFRAHGAAQDEDVFKFAADVTADQTTEVDRRPALSRVARDRVAVRRGVRHVSDARYVDDGAQPRSACRTSRRVDECPRSGLEPPRGLEDPAL